MLKYTGFAIVSIVVNVLVQYFFFAIFEGWWVIYVALFFGTLAGLITKYYFDKRWIFEYKANNNKENIHKFGLYTLMGVFTTFIFWGTEFLFFYFIQFQGSQYIGGCLGLIIGYIIKYFLDKKYVFKVL